MSVSGWETRSTTSAVSVDERRARQAAAFASQQQQTQSAQFQASRSRRSDVPSRHQSFPVQQPPHAHHSGHHGSYADSGGQQQQQLQQRRRQSQNPQQQYQPPPQYDPRGGRPPSGFREQVPSYDQRDVNSVRQAPVSRPSPSPQQQQRKQYNGGSAYNDQRAQYTEPLPLPPRQHEQYPRPEESYEQYRQHQHDADEIVAHGNQNPADEEYGDALPPPLPIHRGPSPGPIPVELPDHAVRATASPSTSSSADEEPVNIDDVLLGRRWSIHVISHLYQFARHELSDYAHELVKFLRGHAVMTYEQEFGYSVMIRHTPECIAFQVVEARDLHAEFLVEKMEQPQRSNQKPELEKQESSEHDVRHRSGSFILYFPKSAEDASNAGTRLGPLAGNRHGRPGAALPRNTESGNDGSSTDAKYVLLLRGNEELMAWVCSWVQRRFQCVVGLHVVRVTEENLRRVTRNWVIEALEREEKVEKAKQRKAERLRKISAASGDDMATAKHGHKVHDTSSSAWPMRAPLLLKYRSKTDTDVVKAFTMTMPWANVRRVHALMDGGVGSALGSVPEVIERLEHLYFGNLQKDIAAMTLTGVQMDELEVDTQGKVKFFKSTMVHSVLQSFLDIFVVQQVQGPTDAITTF